MTSKNILTIAILARELGLGKATVSLALRDDPRIRKETRARVQRHAEKRGYSTNPMVAHVMSQLRSAKVSEYRATVALINVAPRENAIRQNTTYRAMADGFRRRAVELSYTVEDMWIGDELFADPVRLQKVFHTRRMEGMAFLGMPERAQLPDPVHTLLSRSVFVGLGVRLTQPLVHCCTNNQYGTAMAGTRRLLGAGFRRVGLVISRLIDRQTDGRFTMGFRRAMEEAGWRPEAAAGMVHTFQANDRVGFFQWLDEVKADALLCTHTEILEWLKSTPEAGRKLALAHLDWDPSMLGWAGMNQHNGLVGAFGADLLTAHLARRDLGLPPAAKTMEVEGEWVDGRSLRPAEFLG